MNKDVEYTLLEIIEGPKRINSIKHENLFDYLLQATEAQDRFESFMAVLEQQVPWAYLGFGLMASDMIPFSKLFESELSEELVDVRYRHGAVTEYTIFKMILNYFDRGLLSEEKHRSYLVRYMAETLAADEYAFVIGCLKQTYKKEIFSHMKKMHQRGKMGKLIQEFFSFCVDRAPMKNTTFGVSGIPVKKYDVVKKIGSVLFSGNTVLSKENADKILASVQKPNTKPILPRICELYIEEGNVKPFMYASVAGVMPLRETMQFNDTNLVELIYNGCTTFVCVQDGKVVSVVSSDNGGFERVVAKCKNIKKIILPLVFLSTPINVLYFKDEEGNEVSALMPQGSLEKLNSNTHISFIKYKNIYYYEGVYSMETADA